MPRRPVDWKAEALKLPGARAARPSSVPPTPQLARLATAPPAGAEWLHELKLDGYRILSTVTAGSARLWSRNAIEWTAKLPKVTAAIEALGLTSATFDGELVAGQGTQADFNLLQATLSGERKGSLRLVMFDLLHLEGVDLTKAALLDRKDLLRKVLSSPAKTLAFSSHVVGNGAAAFAVAAEQGFEGIIAKRAAGLYKPGRGDDWRKAKHIPSEEFAVVGWMPGEGARGQGVGSLLLATPDADHGWRYVGRVGSGFTNDLLLRLNRTIGRSGHSEPTAYVPPGKMRDLRSARWLSPAFVAEVFLRGVSTQGVLRQPSLKALRMDKKPVDLTPFRGGQRP